MTKKEQIYILYLNEGFEWDMILGVFTNADELLKRRKEVEEFYKDDSHAEVYYHVYDANVFIPPWNEEDKE